MSLRIAVITDLHFQGYLPAQASTRQGYFADILLLRAVMRFNRFINPDIVLILGDLLDDPTADAPQKLTILRRIIDKLAAPVVVIPGNHDPAPEIFYQTMPRPPPYLDVKGARFVIFLDRQTDNFQAWRTPADLTRLRNARQAAGDDFRGPIITVQHVPIFPPGSSACPYNYTNAAEVLDAMRAGGVQYAISGHYHEGLQLTDLPQLDTFVVPALCRPPFHYMLIEIENQKCSTTLQALANPPEAALTDYHIHTPYAFCNENMDICRTLQLARLFNLQHIVFSEHSGQLYHPPCDYWSGKFFEAGDTDDENDRMQDYFDALSILPPEFAAAGLELDCRHDGQPCLLPAHRHLPRLALGAVHYMRSLRATPICPSDVRTEFLQLVEGLLRAGISILAHPWRIFYRHKIPTPDDLFPNVVELLKKHNAAAELNFHTNAPPPEFFKQCIANDVKIAFGSDAHNLYEIGEFFPHLQFIRTACGYQGALHEILLDFKTAQQRQLTIL